MCRLYGFRSAIVSRVHESLVAAENALARQSEQHRDGWGLAHYVARFPHIIRNDQQALVDSLYQDISAVVATRTFLAHIRQATVGQINVLNCHPFQYGAWTMAHNGQIEGYGEDVSLRERILQLVDQRFRRHILGSTDSEVIFHVFLSRLARLVDDIQDLGVGLDRTVQALRQTVEEVTAICGDGPEHCKLSLIITNGSVLVGYRRHVQLYYSTYKTLCPERASCFAYDQKRCESEVDDGIVKHLIVASEVISGANVWKELRDDEYAAVDHGMNFHHALLS